MVGTDMAVGKMTAGLELHRTLWNAGPTRPFWPPARPASRSWAVGIPLDAFRVDHAAGAVERMVLEAATHDIVIVEGQGSLLHPGSTATLPLMRGSCANRMILCHRAGMTHLDTLPSVKVPPLAEVVALNEAVAAAAGALTPARVAGIAVNTRDLDADPARTEIARIGEETGLPVTDPVRYGAGVLADALIGPG